MVAKFCPVCARVEKWCQGGRAHLARRLHMALFMPSMHRNSILQKGEQEPCRRNTQHWKCHEKKKYLAHIVNFFWPQNVRTFKKSKIFVNWQCNKEIGSWGVFFEKSDLNWNQKMVIVFSKIICNYAKIKMFYVKYQKLLKKKKYK